MSKTILHAPTPTPNNFIYIYFTTCLPSMRDCCGWSVHQWGTTPSQWRKDQPLHDAETFIYHTIKASDWLCYESQTLRSWSRKININVNKRKLQTLPPHHWKHLSSWLNLIKLWLKQRFLSLILVWPAVYGPSWALMWPLLSLLNVNVTFPVIMRFYGNKWNSEGENWDIY